MSLRLRVSRLERDFATVQDDQKIPLTVLRACIRAAETEDPQDLARAERLCVPFEDLMRDIMESTAIDDG